MRTTSILGHAFGHGHNNYDAPKAASSDLRIAYSQLQDLIAHANAVTRANIGKGIPGNGCSPDKIQVRRKWEALSPEERIAHRSAVQCMQKRPAKSPPAWSPGAKTRFDDFVASHIEQTWDVHGSGTFLGYHWWMIAELETALRGECGYRGTQPYWDWALAAMTGLEASPLFHGSETSMGGNGEYIPETGPLYYPRFKNSPGPPIVRPTGTGGGCVKSGPFSDYIVNMGPHLLPLPGPGNLSATPSDRLAYEINLRWVNSTKIVNTIVRPQSNVDSQRALQGADYRETFGVHGDGHMIVGGDPGGDFGGNGPAEPTSYMLHYAVDMYWWFRDWDQRVFGSEAISGTNTGLNQPPSADTTFETVLRLNHAGKNASMADVISTIDGQLCYIYE